MRPPFSAIDPLRRGVSTARRERGRAPPRGSRRARPSPARREACSAGATAPGVAGSARPASAGGRLWQLRLRLGLGKPLLPLPLHLRSGRRNSFSRRSPGSTGRSPETGSCCQSLFCMTLAVGSCGSGGMPVVSGRGVLTTRRSLAERRRQVRRQSGEGRDRDSIFATITKSRRIGGRNPRIASLRRRRCGCASRPRG